jgi:hypothetical protein
LTRYACFNRAPFVASYRAPDGHWCDGQVLTTKAVSVKTTALRKCQYILSPLGQADPRCVSCKWTPGGEFDILEKKA